MSNTKKSLKDRWNYFYISKIKKSMTCPSCKQDQMIIDKKTSIWKCKKCNYELSNSEFENDYVFWFCDECDTYLNTQENFDKRLKKHICCKCGYENDITNDNIKGICSDCGKTLANKNQTLCDDCKQIRKERTKQWLIAIGKILGTAAIVAGSAYAISKTVTKNSNNKIEYSSKWFNKATLDELNIEREKVRMDYVNPNLDIEYRAGLWNVLNAFDNAISKKQWAGKEPTGPAFHREHGWYLPNDD